MPDKDFFISYTSTNRKWAEWIAWCLEEEGYSTIIQAWDFRPGGNVVLDTHQAIQETQRTLLILSPDYLEDAYTQPEWAATFANDPIGIQGRVLPVRIAPCQPEGLLKPITPIDLVGLEEPAARQHLLTGIQSRRIKPLSVPFPAQRSIPERPNFPGALPAIWNIPYPRNSLFTGREKLLTQLSSSLKAGQPTALSQPQAISGLGGIGKTQLAVEYAYQHHQDYQAVFWVLADKRESLISGFATMAQLLNLPQKDEQDQNIIIKAMLQWLKTHTHWLLILDNADDLTMVREFLPSAFPGHILLTTRAQAMGRLAERLEVDTMDQDMGAIFLLRRAGLIAKDATLEAALPSDVTIAREISKEMGGLPLALDQAGAYIEETSCGLSAYQQLYNTRRKYLLKKRGGLVDDHPESVATTWSLAFEKVEQANPAAADLLRLCAFLAPDAIPEEIITQGITHLGLSQDKKKSGKGWLSKFVSFLPKKRSIKAIERDPFVLDEAIAVLGSYSLIRRDSSEKMLTIHRLVQVVLMDAMDESTAKQWAEQAVRAASAVFPKVEHSTWPQCERLLTHAQRCTDLTVRWNLQFPKAAFLLNQAGGYLYERARYREAEPLFVRALEIREQMLGPHHLSTAASLNNLAGLYENQGKYSQAEPLYLRALDIYEQMLGHDHPDVAQSLSYLAGLYKHQGKYSQAEPLCLRALEIEEQKLGHDHPSTATSLNNLAILYNHQGKHDQAESLHLRALEIRERELGPHHPDVAQSLNNLAGLYKDQGKYSQAEPLCLRALEIREQKLGPHHPDVAQSLNNLAGLYKDQGKYSQAEPLYVRALHICEQVLGHDHPDTAAGLNNLALLHHNQKKHSQAEYLYIRALQICEQQLGADHPHTKIARKNYALLLQETKQGEKAVEKGEQDQDGEEPS